MKALRPSLVRSLKPRIAEIADEFLDEIEPGAETDFVTTVGRIPAALMTELIGVPRDMRERFIEMSSAQMLAITIDPNRDAAEAKRIQRARGGVPRLLRRAAGRAAGERRRRRRPRQHHRPVGARRWTGAPRHGDLVHPHVRQRRRDDPGAPLVRRPGAGRAPRPAAPPRRAAGADRERDRGDAALLPAQLVRVPHRHAGRRDRRAAHPRRTTT